MHGVLITKNEAAQQCVAAELRHPCRKRLPSSFDVGSRSIILSLAFVFRFDQGRRRPHNPLGELANNVAEASSYRQWNCVRAPRRVIHPVWRAILGRLGPVRSRR